MTKRIGLIVNPIAGMGGSVGLKGTDGAMAERAQALGAATVTPQRTRDLLAHMADAGVIAWLAAPGAMGAAYLDERGIPNVVVGEIGSTTTAADTRRIAREMVALGIDLLVFVGGDGTARDIVDAVGAAVPVVGIPAGVKVYSAVFAMSPGAAAALIGAFEPGGVATEHEVLDIDEEAFREDRLSSQLYGYLRVPATEGFVQPGKQGTVLTPDTEEAQRDLAASVVEDMDEAVLYLLGPGSTVRAIADALGIPKTLLGVDAVVGGAPLGSDLNEQAILALLERYPHSRIIVTPLGGNGFIFGRGNKPFTPQVIRQVGTQNVIVVSTEAKLRGLPELRVDTGDEALDSLLAGYIEVVIGYHLSRVVKVIAA